MFHILRVMLLSEMAINISDRYLQGILIGYIKDVKLDSNNLTQSGYIVPAVNFNNLQEVLVITQLKE